MSWFTLSAPNKTLFIKAAQCQEELYYYNLAEYFSGDDVNITIKGLFLRCHSFCEDFPSFAVFFSGLQAFTFLFKMHY